MKTVLTHTYFLADDAAEQRVMKPYPPLGVLYLSAWLKQHGWPVEVIDTTFTTWSEFESALQNKQPEVLGIHCNMRTKSNVLKLIDFCKERGIISILGGPDASTQINQFLDYGADIIISGEGEDALLQVLNALSEKNKHSLHQIPNVSFKSAEGDVIQNERQNSKRRLDDYPFPDRDAIDLSKYLDTWQRFHGQRPVSLITARGCAFKCKWCSHTVYGHTHRRRTPANVVTEIKQIIKKYRPTHLWFADDVFTVNNKWLGKFADLLKSENILLPFECIGRADRFTEETARILKEIGCYRMWLGAESGSNRVLGLMDRGVTKEQVFKVRELCRQHEIDTGIFIMYGYPGEDLKDVKETIEFVRELQPEIYLTTVAYPLRGTRMYDELAARLPRSDWVHENQTDVRIPGRFSDAFYRMAVLRTASEYRRVQLARSRGQTAKRVYHTARSMYCDWKMKKLAGVNHESG